MNMALEKLLAVGREEGRLEDIKKASLDQEFRKQLLRELKL